MKMKKLIAFAAAVLLCASSAAFASPGLVRVAVKGTDVNMRWYPDVKEADSKADKANAGMEFIAEETPVEAYDDKSNPKWYRLIFPADKIEGFWNPRCISARFVTVKPLAPGDAEKIAATYYGREIKPTDGGSVSLKAFIDGTCLDFGGNLPALMRKFGPGKQESWYTGEFPGMIFQSYNRDDVEVILRHRATELSEGNSSPAVSFTISEKGLSVGPFTVGRTTRDEVIKLLGEPGFTVGTENVWGDDETDGGSLTINFDPDGTMKYIGLGHYL